MTFTQRQAGAGGTVGGAGAASAVLHGVAPYTPPTVRCHLGVDAPAGPGVVDDDPAVDLGGWARRVSQLPDDHVAWLRDRVANPRQWRPASERSGRGAGVAGSDPDVLLALLRSTDNRGIQQALVYELLHSHAVTAAHLDRLTAQQVHDCRPLQPLLLATLAELPRAPGWARAWLETTALSPVMVRGGVAEVVAEDLAGTCGDDVAAWETATAALAAAGSFTPALAGQLAASLLR